MINIRVKDQIFRDIDAIVFDKDGTLEDSTVYLYNLGLKCARILDAQIPGVGEPLLMAFGINGDRVDPTGLMAVGSRQENEIAAAAYIAETGKSWHQARQLAREAFQTADRYLMASPPSPPFPTCLNVLKRLSGQGFKLAILSAAKTDEVEKFVRHHQLDAYFQLLLGSDGKLSKPDPAIYHYSCQQLGVDPSNTLMIGDAETDMIMAKSAGCAGAIGIIWQQNISLQQADVIINDLLEIEVFS